MTGAGGSWSEVTGAGSSRSEVTGTGSLCLGRWGLQFFFSCATQIFFFLQQIVQLIECFEPPFVPMNINHYMSSALCDIYGLAQPYVQL